MNSPTASIPESPRAVCSRVTPLGAASRLKGFIFFAAFLTICFAKPLFALVLFAAKSDLYSYILLIPFVSAYLIWTKRVQLEPGARREVRWAMIPLTGGAVLLAGCELAMARGWSPAVPDYLTITTLSFLLFLVSGSFLFFGKKYLRALAFPVAFAFFSVPFPDAMRLWIERILQHGSANIAAMMLELSGMPVFQDNTHLYLPGFGLEVAPECSGIHSSLILFITSLVAGYMFFRSNWRRLALALLVIPLAYLRNGFRIFTIAQLCVHIGPEMINSPIHRRGGSLFFALSLVPFMLVLLFLRKQELRKRA